MSVPELLIVAIVGSLILCLAILLIWSTGDRGLDPVRVPYTLLILLALCVLIGLVMSEVFPNLRLPLWLWW